MTSFLLISAIVGGWSLSRCNCRRPPSIGEPVTRSRPRDHATVRCGTALDDRGSAYAVCYLLLSFVIPFVVSVCSAFVTDVTSDVQVRKEGTRTSRGFVLPATYHILLLSRTFPPPPFTFTGTVSVTAVLSLPFFIHSPKCPLLRREAGLGACIYATDKPPRQRELLQWKVLAVRVESLFPFSLPTQSLAHRESHLHKDPGAVLCRTFRIES
jgi:hypothetical protein